MPGLKDHQHTEVVPLPPTNVEWALDPIIDVHTEVVTLPLNNVPSALDPIIDIHDSDSETEGLTHEFKERVSHLDLMLNEFYSMGLPRINTPISDALLIKLKGSPTDKDLILRAISIKLEGCSVNYHLSMLSQKCLTYLQSLVGHRPIEIETMTTIIYQKLSDEFTTLKK